MYGSYSHYYLRPAGDFFLAWFIHDALWRNRKVLARSSQAQRFAPACRSCAADRLQVYCQYVEEQRASTA